jgi:hypothetical protein
VLLEDEGVRLGPFVLVLHVLSHGCHEWSSVAWCASTLAFTHACYRTRPGSSCTPLATLRL